MPTAPQRITKPKLLLGEGVDEVRFFEALLDHLTITDVQVMEVGGKTRLAAFLRTLVAPLPGFEQLVSLAVTRDADAHAPGAFQSVCDALRAAGLPFPAAHDQVAAGPPRCQVLILPDGQNPGMLEDLCLASVSADPAFPCVEAYFQCALSAGGRQPNNSSKARLHAWLASEVIPDKRLGEAAQARYWPWASPAFDELKQFLQTL